jgi:hypothetical protein
MVSRDGLLDDPRSGAKPLNGKARQGRPPRDQATRDALARKRPANAAAPRTRTTKPKPPARRPRPARELPGPGKGGAAAAPATSADPAAAAAAVVPDPGNQAPRTPASSGGGRSFATEGSGAFLALFVYPLVLNFLRGGQGRAWGWVKAKWVNQPYGAAAPASTTSGGSSNLSAPHNMRRVTR